MTDRRILTPLDRVMRERDEAREALARVEAEIARLREREAKGFHYWINDHGDGTETGLSFSAYVIDPLVAALAGPNPTDTEGDDRD